jgi:acyl carrier protein
MDVEGGVIEALRHVSRRPIEPCLTSDLIADLGLDSLQVIELVAELEDRFDIAIPPDTARVARTVADVVTQVTALLESNVR